MIRSRARATFRGADEMLHEKSTSAGSASSSDRVFIARHPLIAAKLTTLRDENSAPEIFRKNLEEISVLLAIEATRDWSTDEIEIQTPLASCAGEVLRRPVVLVPILRAGLGMTDGILRVLPQASVGHLGLYRDKKTLRPVTYYRRLPSNLAEAEVLLLDPMLATGFSACAALSILKEEGARHIRFVCLLSCDAGIRQLHSLHPGVEIFTAAVDPILDESAYIVPGLGDAGDRYFGTE